MNQPKTKDKHVPVAVLRPFLTQLVELHDDVNLPKGQANGRRTSEGVAYQHLEHLTGVHAKLLRFIVHFGVTPENKDFVLFDTADRLLTRAHPLGPLAWHTEPFSEFYGPLPVQAYEARGGYELPEEWDFPDTPYGKLLCRQWTKAVVAELTEMAA